MLSARVIPTLLLRNKGLVKGCKFKNHKYVGDPINAVKIYNDKEVDELIFLDITATTDGRTPNFDLLEDIASQAFMPFGYGGGLRNAKEVEKIFKIGIEKAVLNTSAIENLDLVKETSRIAGSQSIVVSIDVKKSLFGKYRVYSHSGQIDTNLDPVVFALRAEEAGAGELMICSIDREGNGQGYDLDLIERIANAVGIPVIASGGAGSLTDFKNAVARGASAVAAGDMFIYHGKHKAVLITYPEYKELEKLFKGD
nr:AglZ/HisF2 family acetamidino modification protein [uncultured Desulfobacter sp.]